MTALLLLLAFAPRQTVEEFPVTARAGGTIIGAEYCVRSVITERSSFPIRDYLVVEVAIQPARRHPLLVTSGQFTLRINGKKQHLLTQTPGMVSASLKYDDWERRPTLVGSAGMGDAGVIVGRPKTTERFPGDPRPGQTRLPPAPRAPGPEDRSGVDREPPPKPEDVVLEAALPEGETSGFVSGFLFFPFKGKPASIKRLELLYAGPAGEATMRLD